MNCGLNSTIRYFKYKLLKSNTQLNYG